MQYILPVHLIPSLQSLLSEVIVMGAFCSHPAVCLEASVHEERFVLWPRSWVPGRMAAPQSWRSPSICNVWRELCDWISFYDRHPPSSTGVYPGTKNLSCFRLGTPRKETLYSIVSRQPPL